MLQIVKPNTKIPFMHHIRPFLILMLVLALGGLVLPFFYTPNWGTSFRGGTSITMHFTEDIPTEDVRKVFVDDERFESVSVQSLGGGNDRSYVVRTRSTTTLKCDKLESLRGTVPQIIKNKLNIDMTFTKWPSCNPGDDGIRGDFFVNVSIVGIETYNTQEAPVSVEALNAAFNEAGLESELEYDEAAGRYTVKPSGLQAEVNQLLNEKFGSAFDPATGLDEVVTVGADVGAKFRNDAIISLLIALGLMLLYIYIRFDMRYAPATVISLGSSVLFTFGLIVIFQMEVTLETVAALLSLVGYGINDTIVNFDRIRENVSTDDGTTPFAEIVNRSINECLSRTILTSITTLLAIVPMAILATGATKNFAIIMSIGIVVCTFNTVIISCPLVITMDKWLRRNREKLEAKKALDAEDSVSI